MLRFAKFDISDKNELKWKITLMIFTKEMIFNTSGTFQFW
jgi:hypothetical protein